MSKIKYQKSKIFFDQALARGEVQKNLKHSHGFTLIEMLIYMGLLSLMLLLITDIFVSTLSVKQESKSFINIENDARYILSRLSHDIRRSTAVSVPAANQTTASLTLNATTPYSYSLSGNNLVMNVNNGAEVVNLNGSGVVVSNLSFQRIGTGTSLDSIKIRFTLTSNITQTQGQETRNYQTTVAIRCYTNCI